MKAKKQHKPSDVLECEICCAACKHQMMTGMSRYYTCKYRLTTGLECGHLYCTACWTEYLTTKIMDEVRSPTAILHLTSSSLPSRSLISNCPLSREPVR